MIITDWRSIPAGQMAPLFTTERVRWLTNLSWDFAPTISDIERARLGGRLPGVVALTDGRIVGWAYYLLHRNTLQIGGMSAATVGAARRLIAAMLHADAVRSAGPKIAFGFFDVPDVERVFADAGFSVEPYRYLQRDLAGCASAAPARPYDVVDNRDVARTLKAAYASSAMNRPFAIRGTDEEWNEYVTQLTLGNGCGVFDARASVVDEEHRGVALVSAVSSSTAHLCQLAVRPSEAGKGLGGALLAAACARAKNNGRARMTLTVASSNTAAFALYRRFGFSEVARFVYASAFPNVASSRAHAFSACAW